MDFSTHRLGRTGFGYIHDMTFFGVPVAYILLLHIFFLISPWREDFTNKTITTSTTGGWLLGIIDLLARRMGVGGLGGLMLGPWKHIFI